MLLSKMLETQYVCPRNAFIARVSFEVSADDSQLEVTNLELLKAVFSSLERADQKRVFLDSSCPSSLASMVAGGSTRLGACATILRFEVALGSQCRAHSEI
jgi:hypothetical protein